MNKKAIPIGYEDFKELIDKNLYFVDKTLMIREILDTGGKVMLFTRPRRFGKTLNLSMLRRFFEDERTEKGEKIDNAYLFSELAIAECGESYGKHQQQYPVIKMTLKSAKQPEYEMAYAGLVDEIIHEYQRHVYVLEGEMPGQDRERYEQILLGKADSFAYATALKFLSECLARYHGKNVIILIDEYDVPLENAYFKGFYGRMTDFIRSLFESALKTNEALAFGAVTGCLRISKESIFTGLNNLKIYSLRNGQFDSSFGFTEQEVEEMLSYYNLSEKYEDLKAWYDGYRFGNQEIYNPWSIINYIDDVAASKDTFPKAYWSNTSSNSIVRELIEEADEGTREEIERLMDNGTIEKPVHEEITYGDIHESPENLWNFLVFTGYLKECGQRYDGENTYVRMTIPNKEIRSVYRNSIWNWFGRKVKGMDTKPLLRALEEGDCLAAEEFLTEQLLDTISYFDYAENYYHGFLAGLLSNLPGYRVVSNRESGTGRPDLILKTRAIRRGRAMVLELKVADSVSQMEEACREALRQIAEHQYEQELKAEGYPRVDQYGICFCRKECMVGKA